MLQLLPETQGNLVAVRVSEKLTQADLDNYRKLLTPIMQQFGTARLYFEMIDFNGWELSSFVGNVLFDLTHGGQFGNVAMVGEKKWQDWAAQLVDPIKKGEVRYFDIVQREDALQWLHGAEKSIV